MVSKRDYQACKQLSGITAFVWPGVLFGMIGNYTLEWTVFPVAGVFERVFEFGGKDNESGR